MFNVCLFYTHASQRFPLPLTCMYVRIPAPSMISWPYTGQWTVKIVLLASVYERIRLKVATLVFKAKSAAQPAHLHSRLQPQVVFIRPAHRLCCATDTRWDRQTSCTNQLHSDVFQHALLRLTAYTDLQEILDNHFIMAALWNRAGHYIFALWFLSFCLLFCPRLISAAADWICTVLLHMVWP